jgi:hypothetical protein
MNPRLRWFVIPAMLVAWTMLAPGRARAAWIWVEGEKPAADRMNRHPWYDQVKRDQFSGGDFISNFHADKPGEAEYRFTAPQPGDYDFWVRANPLQAKISYALNDRADTPIDLGSDKRGEVNVAADGKPDLRFLAWSKAGRVALRAGENTIRFRMTSENNHHGYLDCFVFSTDAFQPRGLLKPDQQAAPAGASTGDAGWFAFDPPNDTPNSGSAIDLRFLNEKFAGEHGFIGVKDGEFVRTGDGVPIRFWAVNGPPHELKGDALRRCARLLARYGVNLVRVHGGYFNPDGDPDPARVRHAVEIVEAMKAEGIYTHFSIYFPLWLAPKTDATWLAGYDGKKHPFAALLFNPEFQARYRQWWTALLTTPGASGKSLIDEPAVASLEMQNEDSFFFWTFAENNLPDEEWRLLETQFGDWLAKKHGSINAAFERWKSPRLKRDAPDEGRVGFRPLWNIFSEKTARDQDTARFLLEVQTKFYADTRDFLRKLGFKGPITASNWSTASPEVFGPLEKLSYSVGDFIDRHGYFSCLHKGPNAEWSVREGHTYADRSALRFDAEDPSRPKQFVHPAMDPHYDGKPSMISETTWNRPNRFRSEAPLYFAAYGALQHSDAIVHFAFDGAQWAVKPGFWMQPWTLMSPAMVGQFPAAALIFRLGLVAPGRVLADLRLNREDLLQLKGTPLPQDAALDELRLKDVPPGGADWKAGQRIDPLLHYAGRADVRFTDAAGSVTVADLRPLIDHAKQVVTSSTGELKLDYGKGVLTINAPRAQGASGNLGSAGPIDTADLSIQCDLDLAHVVAVSLDDQPLGVSSRILLQVMSEEKASGFRTEPVPPNLKRIAAIGTDPWLVKNLAGTVKFKRNDAAQLKVTPLDFNGHPAGQAGAAREIRLLPATVYYLISR